MVTRAERRNKKQGNFTNRWNNPTYGQMFGSKQPIFQQDVESKPSPVPTKGWDAISPLSNMEPDFAVVLDNAVPRPTWVELRGGSSVWVQGLGAVVETLIVYRPAESIEQMFAVAGGTFYDVSNFSSPSVAVSGFNNSRWQYINFTPAGGTTHIIAVNGEDFAGIYDGISWGPLSITGIATNLLSNVAAHKRRIWFIEKDSNNAWYLNTDAIAGTATKFELGSLLTKGSFLVAMGIWTVDGGNGPDDFAVFISNKGQAVIFKGTDPNNANAWFHVGTFNLPPPLGHRCFLSFGSDLLYISLEGLLPISKALPFDPSGVRSVALTNRIQNAMLSAAQNGRTMFGWECKAFPLQSLLVMNVPVVENSVQVQFVMNTLTGAWCRFTGWDSPCYEIYNESLFFGTNNGGVNLAYVGKSDVVEPIKMDMKTAFNYYDDPGRQKYMTLVRPYIVAGGSIFPTLGIDIDFGDEDFEAITSNYIETGSLWDVALWDVASWSNIATGNLFNDWQTVGAVGTAIALRMKINLLPINLETTHPSVFDSGVFDEAIFDGGGIFSSSGEGLPILRFNSFQVVMEHGNALG